VTPIASAPIGAREFDVRFAPFAFATVEDDPDIAGVREQPAELVVPIQAPAGDDEDEHARDATSDAPARQPRSRSDALVVRGRRGVVVSVHFIACASSRARPATGPSPATLGASGRSPRSMAMFQPIAGASANPGAAEQGAIVGGVEHLEPAIRLPGDRRGTTSGAGPGQSEQSNPIAETAERHQLLE
jgi:hypothetical protein